MITDYPTRRDFSVRVASLLAVGATTRGGAFRSIADLASGDGLSHTAESIHQEVVLHANPTRVYQALTDAGQFTAVMAFSTVPKAAPAQIARDAGGAFTIFDGYVTGRHVELVPDQRIVQAWRAGSWAPGIYSMVRFELKREGTATRISFDHTGFPKGEGQHLAAGWHANYWRPLEKYLA